MNTSIMNPKINQKFEVTVWQKVRATALPVVLFFGKIQKIY